MNRSIFRTVVGVSAGAVLALAVPLAASAHVTVNPSQAEPGGYSQLTFRVPNESDTAGTVGLSVALPADTPFAYVSYEPVPGWTAEVQESDLAEPATVGGTEVTRAATSINWTADSGVQIEPGQFQTFAISVGPVPEVGSIPLTATQTYSDGEVVVWGDEADGDHPAPVLYVTDEPAGDHHGGSSSAAGDEDHAEHSDDGSTDGMTTAATVGGEADGLARGLSIAALVLAAIGAVLGAYAAFGRRRKA